MSADGLWLLGLSFGLSLGIPVGLFLARILEVLTRPVDDV